MLPPGVSLVENRTGRPEPVHTADQWDGLMDRLDQLITAIEQLIGRPILDQTDLAVVLAGITARRGDLLP